MFFNYLNVAIRNIIKFKLNSAINIVGLGVGFAVSIMIILFVQNENAYDGQHANSGDIYRLNWARPTTGARFATFFNPLPEKAKSSIPDVEALARFGVFEMVQGVGDDKSYVDVTVTDRGYFDMFEYKTLSGDPIAAIGDDASMVITRGAAMKFFGTVDVMGETMTLAGDKVFKIGAVIENTNANSHLVSNVFLPISMMTRHFRGENFWDNNFSDILYQYYRLKPGTNPDTVSGQLMDWMKGNVNKDADRFINIILQPIQDIHFTQDLENEMPLVDRINGIVKPHRQKSDLTIFLVVAALTVSIAAFNFMNLQVAQASKRMKEVGVRKVVGAGRRDVATQFLMESMLLAVAGFIFALALTELFLPQFGSLVTANLDLSLMGDTGLLVSMGVGAIAVGLVAGLYPALFIARLLPSRILRGEITKSGKAAKFRAGLVVLQFAISIGLIAAGGIINKQIDYAFSKSLGYNPNQVVMVGLGGQTSRNAYEAMKTELLRDPRISGVTAASAIPTMNLSDGAGFQIEGGDPEAPLVTQIIYVGHDFVDTLDMSMASGRPFSQEFPVDNFSYPNEDNPIVNSSILLNEAAAVKAGWSNPDDAVGQKLIMSYNRGGPRTANLTIVGVVKNAQYRSARTDFVPISFVLTPFYSTMAVRITGDDVTGALDHINNVWKTQVPESPISLRFLDDEYAALYDEERQTLRLFIGFSFIAVFIACMGLYGLASFMAEQRTKEIGIRKVMGATVAQIVSLLSWDFSKLVIVANLIGWPVAWVLMENWLTSFAFRTEMDVVPFVTAGVAALVVAAATIAIRALKAAKQNPIMCLGSE